jgi:hypothetical protein
LLKLMRGASSKNRIAQSNLPTVSSLEMFVSNADALMGELEPEQGLEAAVLEQGPLVHAWYCNAEKVREHLAFWLMEYEQLRDDLRCDNVAAARRVPELLKMVGLKTIPEAELPKGGKPLPEASVRQKLENNLERLAEEEHNGWMLEKLLNGYRYAEIRDEERRRHPALKPYAELHDIDKERDRGNVRRIPDLVRETGWAIVPARRGSSKP